MVAETSLASHAAANFPTSFVGSGFADGLVAGSSYSARTGYGAPAVGPDGCYGTRRVGRDPVVQQAHREILEPILFDAGCT